METSDNKPESGVAGNIRPEPENLNDDQLKAHMEEVDKKIKSPEQRAAAVFAYLQKSEFTTWDVACFCVNFLGTMSSVWPWLTESVRGISSLVYRVHYFFTEKVLGEERKLG